MDNVTDIFIKYLEDVNHSLMTDGIRNKAQECLIDYLGAAYAGAHFMGNRTDGYISESTGPCVLLGKGGLRSDVRTAAFINGFNAHVMELDDGHRFGMIHLGAVIVSAVMAVGQLKNISYESILRGIVMGYEAAVRLALSIQPGHKKAGFHTTGTCGTIGAAAGCAYAMGFDVRQLKSALSAAATSASGLLEIQEDASELKPYNAAYASMSGVSAALIGECALIGSDDILGGRRGFVRLFTDSFSLNALAERNKYCEIERIYVKPYASCRHCHSAIEAALELSFGTGCAAADIKEIIIDIYKLAINGHDHKQIKGVASAKLSMPYAVAAAFVLHSGDLETFNIENLTNDDILDLISKITVRERAEFTEEFPGKRIAEVSVILKDGTKYSKRVDYAKGEPENPMSSKEILDKFYFVMKWCGQKERAKELINLFSKENVLSSEIYKIL